MDIRLIAIDIDGTLLNEKTNWPSQPLTQSLLPVKKESRLCFVPGVL